MEIDQVNLVHELCKLSINYEGYMSNWIKHIIMLINLINLVTWCVPMDRELIDGRVQCGLC